MREEDGGRRDKHGIYIDQKANPNIKTNIDLEFKKRKWKGKVIIPRKTKKKKNS